MFCTKCGMRNEDDNKFCMECGSKIFKGETIPGPAESLPEEFGQQRLRSFPLAGFFQRLKGGPWKIPVVTFGAFVVVVIVANLLFPGASFVLGALTFPDQVVAGEDFVVSVNLENTGRRKGTCTLTLCIDEEEYLSKQVPMRGGLVETVFFEIKGTLAPGVHRIGIEELAGSVKVLKPAEFKLSDLNVNPSSLRVRETAELTVTVTNLGEVEGSITLSLDIEGEARQTKEFILKGGSHTRAAFIIVKNQPGSFPVRLNDQRMGDVRVLRPAEFELSGFSVNPGALRVGEEARVYVTVSNLGEVEGSYTLSLDVEGEAQKTEEVTLQGKASTVVTFTIVKDKPGNFQVNLNDLNEVLQVWKIERPRNGTVLINKLKGGYGHLKIRNNNDQDYVIALASTSNPSNALLLVYVRSKSSHTVKSIKNGTYLMFFVTGEDWDSYTRKFTKNAYHQKFEETAKYTSKYPRYDIVTISFGYTGSTSQTGRVPEEDFPQ